MRYAVTAWPWVLAALVLAPVLAPGYVLSYDMVFVPDLALRPDFLGLGTNLPRAVPSDAVVAVVDEVVPGMWLQKLVLVAALVLAGTGARRLVPRDNGVAQLAATSLYVWNPYVAERLGIGHWPVLLAYAALPWVFDAARRMRKGERTALPGLVLWLALAALSAAGGVMAALLALVSVWGRGAETVRRSLLVLAAALVVNAPWLVAGLLHGGDAVTDPASVEAFAASGEGPLPMPFAALGLGGIWNAEVVPVTRDGWAAVAALLLTVAVCAVGWRAWTALLPGRDRLTLAVAGALGVGIALAGAFVPGVVEWFVATVPGGGLFRDGARFLGLLAPLEASLFGVGAGVLAGVMRERLANIALATGAVLMPLALMPDLAWGLAGDLRPVDYPAEYAEARAALEQVADGETGDVLVLPFTSYRVPPWNHGRRTLDPLGRYLTPDYVASDDLYVSGRRLAGEDERARRIESILDGGDVDVSEALRAEGVAWVAVDLQAQAALGRPSPRQPTGSTVVHEGAQVKVWDLGGEVASREVGRPGTALLAAAWVASSGLVLVCLVRVFRLRLRGPRNVPSDR